MNTPSYLSRKSFSRAATLARCASFALAAAMAIATAAAHATDVAQGPLRANGLAKPNVIFGMDDSGSMDLEVLLNANEGLLWYTANAAATTPLTAVDFNASGAFFPSNSKYRYGYLFPNGCAADSRVLCDAGQLYAIPATAQFAAMRSSSVNPQYYNPRQTYVPWDSATVGGTLRTFTAATPSAARSHPLNNATLNLTGQVSSSAGNWTFNALPGMVFPAGVTFQGGCSGPNVSNGTPTAAISTVTGGMCNVRVPYWPATYWEEETCVAQNIRTTADPSCVMGPNGRTLRRYEIRSTTATYPSGRSYADELQNFANWFQFYRKRKLSLAGSMGQVLGGLNGIHMGAMSFNNRGAVTMYDADAVSNTANGKVVAGFFYSNPSSGPTPTRETLTAIGEQFRTNNSVIQYACQRNAAFIVTDGFAMDSTVSVPSYSKSTWGSGAPYTTTHNGTLADLALAYYTLNLKPALPTGQVPAAPATSPDPAADKNTNLHMNTYAITLGARGQIWPGITDAYTNPVTWLDVPANGSPISIDDLWHATINGRGQMYGATTPEETTQAIRNAMSSIMSGPGGQGALGWSSVNLRAGDSVGYLGSYNPSGWSGDLQAFEVNATSGALGNTPLWSAGPLLTARDPATRKMFTSLSGAGAVLSAGTVGALLSNSGAHGTPADVVAYVRGDRSREGPAFRVRSGLLGAIVNAETATSRQENLVFAAANNGLLHAFDRTTGQEAWAYMPSFAIEEAGNQTQRAWTFRTVLDGTPVVASVNARTLLVGGMGTAGTGFYALDVTGSASLSEAQLAGRVLWEFPNASTPASVRSAMGLSMGKPIVVRTQSYGWVVLLTSGYNSSLDGKGRVFVLDAMTGALRAQLVTTQGSPGAGDSGLAQISAFAEPTGLVRFVYAGDEQGRLWRFDIESGSTLEMGRLTDASDNPLPITAAPELGWSQGRRMVYVGTGRMLDTTDFYDSSAQSFFAIHDNGTSGGNLRNVLAQRTITTASGVRRATGSAINWNTQRGWYATMPAGEKANTSPTLAYGMLSWTTNSPAATACASGSTLYVADAETGLELPTTVLGTAYYGVEAGATLTSRASIARLPDGRLVAATRRADNQVVTRTLTPSTTVTARKLGWKEIR